MPTKVIVPRLGNSPLGPDPRELLILELNKEKLKGTIDLNEEFKHYNTERLALTLAAIRTGRNGFNFDRALLAVKTIGFFDFAKSKDSFGGDTKKGLSIKEEDAKYSPDTLKELIEINSHPVDKLFFRPCLIAIYNRDLKKNGEEKKNREMFTEISNMRFYQNKQRIQMPTVERILILEIRDDINVAKNEVIKLHYPPIDPKKLQNPSVKFVKDIPAVVNQVFQGRTSSFSDEVIPNILFANNTIYGGNTVIVDLRFPGLTVPKDGATFVRNRFSQAEKKPDGTIKTEKEALGVLLSAAALGVDPITFQPPGTISDKKKNEIMSLSPDEYVKQVRNLFHGNLNAIYDEVVPTVVNLNPDLSELDKQGVFRTAVLGVLDPSFNFKDVVKKVPIPGQSNKSVVTTEYFDLLFYFSNKSQFVRENTDKIRVGNIDQIYLWMMDSAQKGQPIDLLGNKITQGGNPTKINILDPKNDAMARIIYNNRERKPWEKYDPYRWQFPSTTMTTHEYRGGIAIDGCNDDKKIICCIPIPKKPEEPCEPPTYPPCPPCNPCQPVCPPCFIQCEPIFFYKPRCG